MSKSIGKNISKNLSSKYSHKLTNHAKQSAINALKTVSKRAIQKAPEATVDLIGKKIADKVPKVSKTSSQSKSQVLRNKTENMEPDKEIPKERYVTPEKRQKIIDNLKLI